MVKVVKTENKTTYQCEICGFHYREKEIAEKCEAWCSTTNSCNLDIIKFAIENESTKNK